MVIIRRLHSKVEQLCQSVVTIILIVSCSLCNGLASPSPRARPLFVDQVKRWLTDQCVAYHEVVLEQASTTSKDEHATAASAATTWLLEVPVVDRNNSTATVLALNLVPTPARLDECLPPRCAMAMTDDNSNNSNKLENKEKKYSKIIHLHQDVWQAKTDLVQCRLLAQVGDRLSSSATTARRIFARKTTARRIPAGVAAAFLQDHHVWGAIQAKYSYGLFVVAHTRNSNNNNHNNNNKEDDDELVAVATFSSRRNILRLGHAFRSHELLRFCTQRNVVVVGGISKLLKCFIRDQNPDDIVTVIDRDWGDGSSWHGNDRSGGGVGFATVSTMDPIVMAVNPNEPGIRRHLVGAGIRPDHDPDSIMGQQRLGLPVSICDELNQVGITADQARAILARHNYFLVYDAGVERLFKIVNDTLLSSKQHATTTLLDSWTGSVPKYTETYYSNNAGIRALLQEAATSATVIDHHEEAIVPVSSPLQDKEDGGYYDGYRASWRSASSSSGATTTTATTAKLVFSAPSSLDPQATVEVRERSDGWRTLGIVDGVTKSIYHAVFKIDPDTHQIEPRAVVADYIKIMAESFLTVMKRQRTMVVQNATPFRMLHLGLGAGTLARLLSHELQPAGCSHVAVELDSGVLAAMKELLPHGTVVYKGDALTVLRDQKYRGGDAFDGVFVDIFDENNLLPPAFYSLEYLSHLRDDMLKSSGMVMFNFHCGGKEQQRVIEDARATFAQVFSSVHIIQARDNQPSGGNLVLIGSRVDLLPLDEEIIQKVGS